MSSLCSGFGRHRPECLVGDLHENLVQMPLQLRKQSHPRRPLASEIGREHRANPVPPEQDRLVADVDAALLQQVLDVSQRKWKPDIWHNRQADDLGRRLEIADRVGFGHSPTMG